MNKKDIFVNFLKKIEENKLLTNFLNDIFDYQELSDYSYIYRLINEKDKVIIDIYDNISIHRFNRYIFLFNYLNKQNRVEVFDNVYITYLNIFNSSDSVNKLDKLAYLFSLDKSEMLRYADTFLKKDFINILNKL